ncbi:Fe(3+)-transporting ATPase [Thalassoporum mexicanum PCC 7367]|uniref:ABC transporter ATP-binding protein n=1 Tax=Thalassoporum mexicanum TaxID=3457544 RepID=UPI00029F88E1|nr:ABC transporter ATP-binding protein [Pseudanabaena sp. PCC 7367]AFY68374.1 Fe(3+)-transporting ATPase [Pseudanabaena sp. PCC 7367]
MSESPQTQILQLENITKQFSRHQPAAVDHVTLSLVQGELVSFLGPSGCGKTTLLRLIAGFERPQSGAIAIAETLVAGQGQWVPPERREVGMVFQDYALFPHLTVHKNIAFGLRNRFKQKQPAKAQLNQRIAVVLALVGLEGFGDRYPHELSGGQQQRVALARALAPAPRLILLDEPLSNLDVQVRLRLRQELREILKSSHTTAIFVTHDQEEALSIADRVAVMRYGRIEQFDTPEKIYGKPASKFVAEFVTQANFLPVQRQGDRLLKTELGCFDLDILNLDAMNSTQTAAAMSVSNGNNGQVEPTDRESVDQPISPQEAITRSSRKPQISLQTEPVLSQNINLELKIPPATELMVRQEDLKLELDPSATMKIHDRQFLGREYRYIIQTPTGKLINVLDRHKSILPIGAKVRVMITPRSALLFPASVKL